MHHKALKAVLREMLRQVRRNIKSDIGKGATKRDRDYPSNPPMAAAGDVKAYKKSPIARVYIGKHWLVKMNAVDSSGNRQTSQGYNRGDLRKRTDGQGGRYIEDAQAYIEPKIKELLEENLMKELVKKYNKTK